MLFSRVASFLAFILTLGILAVANPVSLETRANTAAVQQAITTLQSEANTILPQIKSAGASKGASAATVAPLITELVAAINTAHSSVTASEVGLKKRQTAEIESAVAGVISNIATTFNGIPIVGLPGILVPVDVAIEGLLVGLDVAVVGLGLAVGALLGDVGGLLAGLGLGLTLGLLGLYGLNYTTSNFQETPVLLCTLSDKLKRLARSSGPKGLPLIGNELQIPQEKQWLKFDEWQQLYGDVVQIRIMGQPVVILSSAKAALDLLEARGNIYSDRPRATMAGELVGWDRGLGYAPYGDRFREFRKMFHQTMGPRTVQELHPLQEKENTKLLMRLLEKPEMFIEHARQSSGATILNLAYGYTAEEEDDPFVKIAEDAMRGFSRASEPGAFIVDRFPWMKHIPRWFPGAGFKGEAKRMREDLERLYDEPFEFVKTQMEAGSFSPSFTSKYLLEKPNPSEDEKEFVKAAAASLYSGGADTTPSSISAFILAMTLYPSVQARGQAEVDRILIQDGKRRLPLLSDRHALPYVNAIVKEVLRWEPAVPLGLPHQLVQDDQYMDFKLAKGTIVWANIWSILHDKNIFPEPEIFRPERFLDTDISKANADRSVDPSFLSFGFGRRICPGMHFADAAIFLAVASILSTFDISKAKNELGNDIEPEVDFIGFISHPKPFKCSIQPRSNEAKALIRSSVLESNL